MNFNPLAATTRKPSQREPESHLWGPQSQDCPAPTTAPLGFTYCLDRCRGVCSTGLFTCIYMCSHPHLCTHADVLRTPMHVHMCAHVRTHACACCGYAHTCVQSRGHTCAHPYMCTQIHMCVCMNMCVHTCASALMCKCEQHSCMHADKCAHAHTSTRTHVCIHTPVHTRT